MKADIIISPKGEVTIITREGTYSGGTEKVSALLKALEARGLNVENAKFEQHRHDDQVSAGQGVQHHAHSH